MSHGPTEFHLRQLVAFLAESGLAGDLAVPAVDPLLSGFSPLMESRPGTLSWMRNQALDWSRVHSAAIVCATDFQPPEGTPIVFLPVSQPRLAFAKALARFAAPPRQTGIEETARIAEGCVLGRQVYVGHYAVIGAGVHVGEGTTIHSGVHIYPGVTIGAHCTVHSGAVLGADGFGFERDEDGEWFKLPHVGGLVIADHVEIGANVCIDRGTLGNTVIKRGAKISDLCHVAHNVTIGERTILVADSMIGGSTAIGDDTWIASAVVKNGLTIGSGAMVGLGSVVMRNVADGDFVATTPARSVPRELAAPSPHARPQPATDLPGANR